MGVNKRQPEYRIVYIAAQYMWLCYEVDSDSKEVLNREYGATPGEALSLAYQYQS